MKKSEPTTYPTEQLLQALFWIWDAFDRANMRMFLIYNTAEDVLQNKDLEGDRVTVGVRDLEWKSGSLPVLKAFTYPEIEKTDNYEKFQNPFNKVPVYVYIFKSMPCLESTNQMFYRNEYFFLPNTYKDFVDIFGIRP